MSTAVDTQPGTIDTLRQLIVAAAPEPAEAAPVQNCSADAVLDTLIPFSSVIILGTVIAIEDHFAISVTRAMVDRAAVGGVTLRKLAAIIDEVRS